MLAVRCLRDWSKISVTRVSFFPSEAGILKTHLGGLRIPKRRFAVLSAALCRLPVRFVSLSASVGTDTGASPDRENFGSLSEDISSRRSFRKSRPDIQNLRHREDFMEEDEELKKPHRRTARRNTAYWYFLQCKRLIKENKLQEALDVFSSNMLKEERLQPEEFNYSVLIGGCGRAGQLKKAFKLYNDMKKRGLAATDATYTALFNACAESPSKQAGLQQALKLEQELLRKNYPLSTITYHALLKTHAITNHIQACVHTLREMVKNGHAVTQEAFHYLLMGCLTDKDTGFRLALQVWRQMLRSGIVPDSKNYTLLLRTARDCGIGDPALASSVLLNPDYEIWREKEDASEASYKGVIDIDLLERQLFLQHSQTNNKLSEEEKPTHLMPVRQTENISLPSDIVADSTAPNLLDLFEGRRGAMLALSSVDTASDRLALIGGAKGFLDKMEANGLSPDLKTLTLLADMMEPGHQSLQMLLKAAKQHQVKLDVAFFNSAIRRTVRVSNPEDVKYSPKAVLHVMRQRNVSLNIQTYGCLALSCDRQEEGLQLLTDMQDAGFRPNVHVFSALIGRATRRLDYIYLKTLLKSMKDLSVWPNEVIIRQLEFAAQYPPNYNQYKSRNNYLVHIDGFRGYYQQWLKDSAAQSTEAEEEQKEQSALQCESGTAVDGLTEAQRNHRAAARRHFSRGNKKNISQSY
ncbi:pentatricopeptide repeat-containing protein 1, mitochondrial isoform X1 [Xiphophorus couchianus]|uniref:pentatricopeptide repeat-containing protein 1, mitochondrial isoform X1 n=1 Tax=Xiphophorus couchianus TaxID=32473 RepID=UPI00101624BA|nr:pentatricopeptide repeat-containing protein 1, mitochondrial-like isoform X1 [Xiphophorus couchianus]